MLMGMQRLNRFAFLTALASLSIAGGCKSDDASGSQSPQQPGAATAAAPPQAEAPAAAGEPGGRGKNAMSREERRAERLKQFDKNGDGRLDRDERGAMLNELVNKRMQRIDRDGDGKITREEASAGRLGPRLLANFDQADSNHDSAITRDELQAAIEARRAARRAERKNGGAAPASGMGAAPPPAEEDDGDDLDEE
jgi:hypothetical protein